jgi:tRNA nucleotidyltransferase (CCA-adding enzyme)
MHMSPRPRRAPILTSDPGALARWLWRELAPERWPLPPPLLPAGTALVGGAVRDGLLGRLAERPDLDLVVEGDAIALARALAGRLGGSCVVLDQDRSIARLVLRGWTIDLARCAGGSLEADLRRRDYTVNAIALPLAPAEGEAVLVDPLGGLADLEAARLVAISEANLLDDPLRLLRGIRLATELAFGLAPQTWDWIRHHHQRLGAVAGERVLAELERLAAAAGGERGLAQVLEAGLLEPWGGRGLETALIALTPGAADARGLTSEERGWALPLARLATVLNGEALTRLPLSRRLEQRCRRLRHWRGKLTGGSGASLELLAEPDRLRMQQELEDDLPALLLAVAPTEAHGALARWRDRRDPLFHPRTPLDGRVLQERLGIRPGPLLGRLIHHLTLEQAFGRLEATGAGRSSDALEAETLRIARQWLGGQGDPRRD